MSLSLFYALFSPLLFVAGLVARPALSPLLTEVRSAVQSPTALRRGAAVIAKAPATSEKRAKDDIFAYSAKAFAGATIGVEVAKSTHILAEKWSKAAVSAYLVSTVQSPATLRCRGTEFSKSKAAKRARAKDGIFANTWVMFFRADLG